MLEQNSFSKGMNQDLSKNLYQKDTYVDALNFSLITEYGLSSGILRNIKGNELFINIPSTSNVVKITKVTTGISQITILGQTFTIDFGSLVWQSTLSSLILSNPVLNSLGIIAQYNADNVVIYSGLDASFNLITVNITASINNANGTVDTTYLSPIQSPKLLGWAVLRDTIFLFTSDQISETPSNSQGQIWKVTYDRFTYEPNISLLYHGRLNLSLGNPIANPGAVICNYETAEVQNMYFTDNYNTPKVINTADLNIMAKSSLDEAPNLFLGQASVQQILYSGNLPVGAYSASYRLQLNSGTNSKFFVPCNYIPILQRNERTSQKDYKVEADNTLIASKSIKFKIFNLDTSYDRIEPVILFKQTPNAVPIIKVLPSQPIPTNGIFEFIYSGNEVTIDFSLDEFTSENIVFETVKTISTKNNYLFKGNVKYNDFDVNFDTRAYRFNYNQQAILTNGQGLPEFTLSNPTSADYQSIPEIADCIQDAETVQAPYTNLNYLYQQDGRTLGGQGLNVSYTFERLYLDQTLNPSPYRTGLDSQIQPGSKLAPYAGAPNTSNTIDLDQNQGTQFDQINNNGAFNNSSSPYYQYIIKGYQRDEVYRFAVVFVSKKGELSYAHWIADIRMPSIWMPLTSAPTIGTDRNDLYSPTCGYDTNHNNYYALNLGIKFTINNLDTIRDQISGYYIVRTIRSDQDKTIAGQGLLMPTILDIDGVTSVIKTVQQDSFVYDAGKPMVNPGRAGTSFEEIFCSFVAPEFLYKNNPAYNANDQIDIQGNLDLQVSNPILANNTPPTAVPLGVVLKNYNIRFGGLAKNSLPVTIDSTNYIENPRNLGGLNTQFVSSSFGATARVDNWTPDSNDLADKPPSYGNKRLIIRANYFLFGVQTGYTYWKDLMFADHVTNGQGTLYLANYRSPKSSQYGGKSYSERSYSEYISTGSYQRVTNNDISLSTNVFGGDTMITLFDYVNGFKNFYTFPDVGGTSSYAFTQLTGILAPIECTFPVQVNDNSLQRSLNKDPAYGIYSFIDNLPDRIEINQSFNIHLDPYSENDTVIFPAKPFPFILNNKYDVRIHKSQPKINGELVNSWGIYKQDEYIDLNTTEGELNELLVHQDRLVSFQNTGIAIVSVNDRSVVTDTTGANTSLGSSGVLSRFDYISNKIGSRHQLGFTQSNDAIFFFDINTKNIYKLAGNNALSLSTAKGMSSFLNNNINGLLQTNDNPYLNRGLTCTYDFHYNEAWFTFKDTVFNNSQKAAVSQVGNTGIITFDYGRDPRPSCVTVGSEILVTFIINNDNITEIFLVQSVTNSTVTAYNPNTIIGSSTSTIVNIACKELFAFTLAFNDFIDQFTSFYSFVPSVYINNYKDIFSPNSNLDNLWIHDLKSSVYGSFYGIIYPSTLKLLINPDPTFTKVFDNYQLMSTSTDANGNDIPTDFFNQIRLYNDTQNTDFQTLPINGNKTIAKRVERNWNISYLANRVLYTTVPTNIFTDLSSPNDKLFAERLRDKYLMVDLIYNNADNNKLQLNSFNTEFRKSAR